MTIAAPKKKAVKKKAKSTQPTHIAMSVARKGKHWALYTYTIQGDKVISVESTDETMRFDAINQFKIASAKQFIINQVDNME